MYNVSIYNLILAWCALHLMFMLIRLIFSDEKSARLKMYGQGAACTIGLIILGLAVNWVWGQTWFQQFIELNRSGFNSAFFMLGFIITSTAVFYVALSLLFGHAAKMWGSWMVDDIEAWSQNN
jgi:hypothetical protein